MYGHTCAKARRGVAACALLFALLPFIASPVDAAEPHSAGWTSTAVDTVETVETGSTSRAATAAAGWEVAMDSPKDQLDLVKHAEAWQRGVSAQHALRSLLHSGCHRSTCVSCLIESRA